LKFDILEKNAIAAQPALEAELFGVMAAGGHDWRLGVADGAE
jgi:hypothetical protein